MNWAHIHLMLNHIPVLGTVFGLALLAWGMFRRDVSLQRAALVTFVVTALAAIPVYLTGEPSEDVVERLAGTAKAAIETHEEAALTALIGIELLGAIGIAGLILSRMGRAGTALMRGAFLVAIVAAGLMAWTANLGGRIRHSELRGSAAQQPGDHEERERGR
jgi:uncharacterized membrane protein